MTIDLNAVFDRCGNKADNLPTKTIDCTHVCNAKHDKFFVLIYMNFMSEIISSVWDKIQLSGCGCPSLSGDTFH